jgi:hypothetical protein
MGSTFSSEGSNTVVDDDNNINTMPSRSFSESTTVLSELEQVENDYFKFEKEIHSIENSMTSNLYKSLDIEEKKINLIICSIVKFQEERVDSILTSHLNSGKDEIKSRRKILNNKITLLLDKCQALLNDCKKYTFNKNEGKNKFETSTSNLSKSYSYESSNTISKLKEIEHDFSLLKQNYKNIVELYLLEEINDINTLTNAKNKIKNIIIILDKFQLEKVVKILFLLSFIKKNY